MRMLTWIGVAAVVSLAVRAHADPISLDGAQISIDVPQGWRAATDRDTFTLTAAGQDVAITFTSVPAGSVKNAVARALEA